MTPLAVEAINMKKIFCKENIKLWSFYFILGFLMFSGIRASDWLIPDKPAEYRICVKDAGDDYMCEVYK